MMKTNDHYRDWDSCPWERQSWEEKFERNVDEPGGCAALVGIIVGVNAAALGLLLFFFR